MCPPLAGGEGSWARGVEIVTGRVPRQDCPELLCARPLPIARPYSSPVLPSQPVPEAAGVEPREGRVADKAAAPVEADPSPG